MEAAKVNLADFIKKANNPQGGVNRYIGFVSAPFFPEAKLHKFTLNQQLGTQGVVEQDMYFTQAHKTSPLTLRFVQVRGSPLIIAVSHSGISPRIFSDADIKPYSTCQY